MDFELSAEQVLIRDMIRCFVRKELEPIVDRYEKEASFPVYLLPALGELGLLGLGFPEECGGTGGHVEVALLTEELARVAGGFCSGVMTHCIGAKIIARFGNADQCRRFLVPALSGRDVCAIAITEPDHGSDVAGLRTMAVRDGNTWRIRGNKMFITNASHADVFMVMCRTGPDRGKNGISMLLVEKGTPGLTVDRPLHKLGWHTSDTCPVHFEDCVVPAESLLGVEGRGFQQLMEGFVFERVIMAAMGVGAAQCAVDDALTYSQERTQFGQPISRFQAIRHRLADMATEVEAARQMTYWAAWQADRDPRKSGPAAMAKLFATEVATRVAGQAVQIYGGMGFMEETRVARVYRDVKILTIGGGTSEVMRSIIAKDLGI